MVQTASKVTSKVATFRERITELLDECDQTASVLAKNLHVSRQTLSAWKTGVRSPKEPTIIAIARYFGVNELWLMGFDVQKKRTSILKGIPVEVVYDSEDDIPKLSYSGPELGDLTGEIPRTPEARIISGGIDRMPPERREQALKILQVAFAEYADYFKEEDNDDA